ncbi:uncharacterized protein LOC133188940 [Saccostrea echinata]|uniref:uncharacterized protein LOC133188940 n=1 Tax=Saccostrea echinata TaxID=191078 RepID=UPI002A7F10BF|nr:uncharacterized protein LOC133188940 [Saccostrea echinata]
MTLTLENMTLTQQIEAENTTFADAVPDTVSSLNRCSLACIIIIIVILALGFIVFCSVIIRKCIERTYVLRSRIQSFIVSAPVSGGTDSGEDQKRVDNRGTSLVINKYRNSNERTSQGRALVKFSMPIVDWEINICAV